MSPGPDSAVRFRFPSPSFQIWDVPYQTDSLWCGIGNLAYYVSVAYPDIFVPRGRETLRARSSEIARQMIDAASSREDLRIVAIPYKLSDREEIFMAASAYWRDDEISVQWRTALLPFAEAHPGPLYDVIANYLQQLRD